MIELYIYGSENPKANGKIHIADENGKVLCGANIRMGECTAQITHVDNDEIWAKPFAGRNEHISKILAWNDNNIKCKRCAKKLKETLTK